MRDGEVLREITRQACGERLQENRRSVGADDGALLSDGRQPAIKGLVVYEAGDYDATRGLRAPGGRLRSSVAMILRAQRGLAESGPK